MACAAGVAIAVHATPALVFVDEERVARALANLLRNAIQISDRGETVLFEAQLVGRRLRLSVTDKGPGIAPARRSAIFEPFFKADGSDASRQAGAGLGLALVKRIVQGHQGEVAVESALGNGSRFTVTLPHARAVAAPAGTAGTVQQPTGL